MSTKHFNIFNTGESSFFTPGVQLANSKSQTDAPAIVYINPENKESVMTWHSLSTCSPIVSRGICWNRESSRARASLSLCPIFPPTLLLLLESGRQVDAMYRFLREYPAKI